MSALIARQGFWLFCIPGLLVPVDSLGAATTKVVDSPAAKEWCQKAIKEVEGFRRPDDKLSAYRPIAILQADLGDSAGARQTVMLAKSAFLARTHAPSTDYYLELVMGTQVATGDIAGIKTSVAKISDQRLRARALSDACELLARRGIFEGAKELLAGVEDETSKARGFAEVALAQKAAGDASGSLASFQQAKAAVGNMEYAGRMIALYEARSGDIDAARQTLASVKGAEQRARGWLTIAAEQASRTDREAAAESIRQLNGDIQKLEPSQKVDVYCGLAKLYLKLNDEIKAQSSINAAREAMAAIADAEKRPFALSAIAETSVEMGDLDAARSIAAQITKSLLKGLVTQKIALAQAAKGDMQGAMSTISQLDDQAKEEVLLEIAAGQARAMNLRAARTTISPYMSARAGTSPMFLHRVLASAAAYGGAADQVNSWAEALDDGEQRAWIYIGAAQGVVQKSRGVEWSRR